MARLFVLTGDLPVVVVVSEVLRSFARFFTFEKIVPAMFTYSVSERTKERTNERRKKGQSQRFILTGCVP